MPQIFIWSTHQRQDIFPPLQTIGLAGGIRRASSQETAELVCYIHHRRPVSFHSLDFAPAPTYVILVKTDVWRLALGTAMDHKLVY